MDDKFLIPVKAVQDDDGHWYVIPNALIVLFRQLLEQGESKEDYEEFSNAFDKYRTGGDLNLIQLYAEL